MCYASQNNRGKSKRKKSSADIYRDVIICTEADTKLAVLYYGWLLIKNHD
jgi:hypothetical protein